MQRNQELRTKAKELFKNAQETHQLYSAAIYKQAIATMNELDRNEWTVNDYTLQLKSLYICNLGRYAQYNTPRITLR